MSQKKLVVLGGTDRVELDRAALETAIKDAEHIIANSAVARNLVLAQITLQKLSLLMHINLEHELKDGWNVKNPALVLRVLSQSAQKQVTQQSPVPSTLIQELTDQVIPVLNIFCEAEAEQHAKQEHGSTSSDDSTNVGASGLLPGADAGATK